VHEIFAVSEARLIEVNVRIDRARESEETLCVEDFFVGAPGRIGIRPA
jgi:hypothetical protein